MEWRVVQLSSTPWWHCSRCHQNWLQHYSHYRTINSWRTLWCHMWQHCWSPRTMTIWQLRRATKLWLQVARRVPSFTLQMTMTLSWRRSIRETSSHFDQKSWRCSHAKWMVLGMQLRLCWHCRGKWRSFMFHGYVLRCNWHHLSQPQPCPRVHAVTLGDSSNQTTDGSPLDLQAKVNAHLPALSS